MAETKRGASKARLERTMDRSALKPIRLGLFSTAPAYYHAPVYRRVAEDARIQFTAIFASTAGATRPVENGYGQPVEWGVDALNGYHGVFLRRAERNEHATGVLALRDIDIVRTVHSGRFDVLWLNGYHTVTHLLAALTQRARGGAVVYLEEQTLVSPRPYWKRALKSMALPLLFRGAYGLYIGTENRKWFRRWGIPDERLCHFPYAVDNAALSRIAELLAPERARLRAEFGIDAHAGPVILSVGRLVDKKQPLHLLEGFRRVRSQRRCTLLIVGSGPLENALRRECRRARIRDVVYAGFLDQTEIWRAYGAADVFALVSAYDETWGLVVNEAMNFGLPIVVSDRVGCARDLVRDGINGFIVDHRDSGALADVLVRLVKDDDLRARLGRESRSMIRAWSPEAAAAGVLKAVMRAVGETRWERAGEASSEVSLPALEGGTSA
jgi:glycosyltransferase involved in cell wall biosynthesis